MYEELSIENIPNAAPVSLLHERECDLYPKCTRLSNFLNPSTHAQFAFESKVGTGDNAVKVRNHNFSFHLFLDRVNEFRSELNENAAANIRWKRANKSDGFIKKTWRETSLTVCNV